MPDEILKRIRKSPYIRHLEAHLDFETEAQNRAKIRQYRAEGMSKDGAVDKATDWWMKRTDRNEEVIQEACREMMKWEERTNQDLAALKKFLLGEELRRAKFQKMSYFTKNTETLLDATDWFKNAVFMFFDMEWYSEWRKELGPAPPTELGFAVIYGEDIIEFINHPDASLEDLLAQIRAFHVRVIERCHMINRLSGCTANTEENFVFGTTCFLTEDQVKTVVKNMFRESTYQTDDERRPLILIG
ncbi:hypothetical protein N0V86_007617 [Didymella sp. IMI 355093]|nr:hypothetical protein N0V86_007617 [Didymella sp. IMI 355093]